MTQDLWGYLCPSDLALLLCCPCFLIACTRADGSPSALHKGRGFDVISVLRAFSTHPWVVLLLSSAFLPQSWSITSPDSVHSADGAFAPLHALCGQLRPCHYFPGLPKVRLRFGNRMPVLPRDLGAPVSKEKLALSIPVQCQVGFTPQDSFCRRLVVLSAKHLSSS